MKEFSIRDVESHNRDDDFWTVIHGRVYDLSGYVPFHPGGAMILLAAGTDSTVMFEQYHLMNREGVENLLKPKEIGTSSCKSPDMGPFYAKLRDRVVERLRKEPTRPRRAAFAFVLDALIHAFMLFLSTLVSTNSPQWQLVILGQAIKVSYWRLHGQGHALGHVHIFSARSVSWWQKLIQAMGVTTEGYSIWDGSSNPRTMLNEPLDVTHQEYGANRGPSEHLCVHHVRSAVAEHDGCHNMMSTFGLLRIADFKHFRSIHCFQNYSLYFWLAQVVQGFIECFPVFVVAQCTYCWTRARKRAWSDLCVHLVGLVTQLVAFRARVLLPLTGVVGISHFALATFLFNFVMPSPRELFYGEHKWNHTVDEHTANTDWGKYMVETCTSLRGISWTWFCWGMADACPATYNYHLEHSIFPSVCYLHLPKIGGIVEATCAEFGMEYDFVDGVVALRRRIHADLKKCAVSSKQC